MQWRADDVCMLSPQPTPHAPMTKGDFTVYHTFNKSEVALMLRTVFCRTRVLITGLISPLTLINLLECFQGVIQRFC